MQKKSHRIQIHTAMTENQAGGSSTKGKKTYIGIIVFLFLIIVVLVWQLLVTRSKVDYIFIEKTEIEKKNYDLQIELDSIIEEYNIVKNEYDSVIHEKDSIILANAEEIQKLISSQADYRKIRKQLDQLRKITQSYVIQIDSLHRENAVLKDENVRIQKNFEKAKQETEVLSQDKEALKEQVELASTLKAYQAFAQGIRMKGEKEELTDKARRTEKIKVCFTISENLVAPPGPKTVYVRIAGPDNVILIKGSGDEYSFESKGQLLQYSVKKQITYRNKAEVICMYWDRTEEFKPGSYSISMFIDGYEIGQTGLELR